MQRNTMCWQIGAARDAAGNAMQVDAEERRVVVIHLAAGLRRIVGVAEMPDAVNLDGIEPVRGIPDEPVDVANRG
ncbi:hypothetical protein [Burkholderia pyrrocinia]|uniref:hypothetical protein n=1 Tax=Burkholderia pyrrocinia TaxID=60550 RepID=UPI0015895BB6|nr:hypothetical protein [Burkholderia pyrrocinia]